MKDDNYFQISGWMINNLKLEGTQLIVFAIIYGFSQDGESKFTGSLKYLQKSTGKSKNTIMKSLSELVENGLLKRFSTVLNSVKFNSYSVNLEVVQKLNHQCNNKTGGGEKTEPGGGAEIAPGGGAEIAPYNTIIDNTNLNNKEYNIFSSFLSQSFEIFNEAGLQGVFFSKLKKLYDLTDSEVNQHFESWRKKHEVLGTEFRSKDHLKNSFNRYLESTPKLSKKTADDLDDILALAEKGGYDD